MLGLKNLLDVCFSDEPMSFEQILNKVNSRHQYGIFHNTIASELHQRLNVPLSSLENVLIPAKINRFLPLSDLLAPLHQKHSLLHKQSLRKSSQIPQNLSRIMPLIKSDGTLYLVQSFIEKEYCS